MKTPYSRDYFPRAPVLLVGLAATDETPPIGPYSALIDTGADGTFVPTSILEQLNVPVIYATNVRSHLSEELRRVSVHRIDLVLGVARLPGVEVVSDDWGSEVIVGRNALNKLQLLLDGPKQMTELR